MGPEARLRPSNKLWKRKLTDHHRFLIDASLQHMRFIEEQLTRLDQEIQRRLQPYQEEYALQTIPGIKETGAARICPRLEPTCRLFPTATTYRHGAAPARETTKARAKSFTARSAKEIRIY